MVTDMQDKTAVDRVTLRYLVRCMVEQSGAISAEQMARRMSLDAESVREEVKYWVDKGLVEIIRPVGVSMPTEGTSSPATDRTDYYRWIRPTDTDYIWQAGLMRDPPLPRLGTVRPIIF